MRDEDLIVGNYYLIEVFNFYFKYNGLVNNELNLEYSVSETVFRDNGYLNVNSYIFKEVSLLEFIKYLPMNHPDRIIFRNKRINSLLQL